MYVLHISSFFKGVNALYMHRPKPLETHIHHWNVELRNCALDVHE